MLSMGHLLLLLSVIIASIHQPVHAGESSPDYYDDVDSPGKLEKSTVAPPIPVNVPTPFFKEDKTVVYINRSAEHIKLDCPVQHYDAIHHQIMWYRNENVVATGNDTIIKDFSVDSQLALTIPAVNATHYNYSCQILPGYIRQNISVQFQTSNGYAPNISWSRVLSVFALMICFF